ncbi:MAG: methyltransferase domain-containing protein [Planctomycetes bacterium]|nr:methyltransferase domain-containing protein [Planctomycetota bacterium]MCB9868522.1 methyltransferase domain-containing protein [Planctomycetota bacterium]
MNRVLTRHPRFATAALLALLASCSATHPTATDTLAPIPEESVRPGINKDFLAPEVDLAKFTQRFEGESREVFVHRHRIVAALDLKPGARVADVGAGTGAFLQPFAKAVGAEGRVYAVDIAPDFVANLKHRAEQSGLHQVEAVQCTAKSAQLPAASVDVAFVCDTYHHFEYPRNTLHSLRHAIRPGGQLVIVDFERIPGKSRAWTLNHVRCGKATVIREAIAAGFRFHDEVAVRGLHENYLIRFHRD